MFQLNALKDNACTPAETKIDNSRARRARKRVGEYRLILILALLGLAGPLAGDVRAHVLDDGFNPGNGPGSAVTTVAVQADGKVYIGGAFDYNGSHVGIARLNADGSLDPTFDGSADGTVFAIKVQADGSVLVGGGFQHMNGRYMPGLARFRADGTFDTFFNPRVEGTVFSIAELYNGNRIMIAGMFPRINGRAAANVAMLTTAGTLDETFNPGYGPDHYVFTLAAQPDNKVLIGGMFTYVNGQPRRYIARLNTDGSLDRGFDPGANGFVRAIAVWPDSRIVVGGDFTELAATPQNHISQLYSDGRIDDYFYVRDGLDGSVRAIGLLPNGGMLIGGEFTQVWGQPRAHLAALHRHGLLDYIPSAGAPVNAISVNEYGKAVVGGEFRNINWVPRNFVARFVPPGSADDYFRPEFSGAPYATVLQPDGKLVVGGFFSQISRVARNNIGRINADGTLDTSFDPGAGADNYVFAITLQPDGRILIGGSFHNVDGRPRAGLARLYPDGKLDEAFDPSPAGGRINNAIDAIAVQPDGRMIVSGDFSRIAGGDRHGLARLNADGTLDTSFNANPNVAPDTIVLQPDGRILIAGIFSRVNGEPAEQVARLNPDGSLDTSFNVAVESYHTISHIGLLPNGKIIIAGDFYAIGGVPRDNIARLHPDGSLDTSFVPPPPPTGERSYITAMGVQTDGMVIIATNYYPWDGGYVSRATISRLNASGWIDGSFAPELDYHSVETILPLPDGKVLLGGNYFHINGESFPHLARLHNTLASSSKLSLSFNADAVTWSRGSTASEVERVSFEISSDGVNYRRLGDGTLVAAGWTLGGLSLPTGDAFFIRARGFTGPRGSGSIFETSREFRVMGTWSEDTDTQPDR